MVDDADSVRRREVAGRVVYWMNRRGLTRKHFADRMGKSVSWVDKLKSGDRQLDRLSVLRHIADALDVRLQVLLDPDEAVYAESCADDREIAALEDALQRYDGICGSSRLDRPPDFGQLGRALRYCWTAFQASDYGVATRLLPDFLVVLQHDHRVLDDPATRAICADYLTQAYSAGWRPTAVS